MSKSVSEEELLELYNELASEQNKDTFKKLGAEFEFMENKIKKLQSSIQELNSNLKHKEDTIYILQKQLSEKIKNHNSKIIYSNNNNTNPNHYENDLNTLYSNPINNKKTN
jgi:esterase/lipase